MLSGHFRFCSLIIWDSCVGTKKNHSDLRSLIEISSTVINQRICVVGILSTSIYSRARNANELSCLITDCTNAYVCKKVLTRLLKPVACLLAILPTACQPCCPPQGGIPSRLLSELFWSSAVCLNRHTSTGISQNISTTEKLNQFVPRGRESDA